MARETEGGSGGSGGHVGDALLELAKAKKLASVMGGAWHDANESDDEVKTSSPKPAASPIGTAAISTISNNDNSVMNSSGGGLFAKIMPTTLRRSMSGISNSDSASIDVSNNSNYSASGGGVGKSVSRVRESLMRRGSTDGTGTVRRRPADGRSPGRRDPVAVAKAEAEAAAAAKLAAADEGKNNGVEAEDPSWRLPIDVDYYTDRAALLRELVKEMPAEKRLSFQTRVANARTKEEVESVLQDFAPRLECLALPHARSRDVDLQQVKKDTARERVVLDGKEIVFWESPSDRPHSWHEELWAMVEGRVMESLLRGGKGGNEATAPGAQGGWAWSSEDGVTKQEGAEDKEETATDKAQALALQEWNKARAVATTSEVFKAMSRTGAGGDAYFALVALFCTANKMVVPVHCQESPITVEFHQRNNDDDAANGKRKGIFGSSPKGVTSGRSKDGSPHQRGVAGKGGIGMGGGGWGSEEDMNVVVTVPSTFDIYLRDGSAPSVISNGTNRSRNNGGRGGGGGSRGGDLRRRPTNMNGSANGGGGGGRRVGASSGGSGGAHGGADASTAIHLVRVRAVVEEEIRIVGSTKIPASSSCSSSERRAAGAGTSGSTSTTRGGSQQNEGVPTPPTLRYLLDHNTGDWSRYSYTNVVDNPRIRAVSSSSSGLSGKRASSAPAADAAAARRDSAASAGPLLTLTRTERRMCVSVVPEPSAVSQMMHSFSRKIGVGDGTGPEPPRVLGL